MSTTWLVSRHAGAVKWLHRRGYEAVQTIAHLDPTTIQPGDTVIGTLPVHLAAAVCARGARFVFLSVDIPAQLRGKELTDAQLDQFNARLQSFHVRFA